MFERFTRKSLTATAAALLAALGVGGAALAQSGKPGTGASPSSAQAQGSTTSGAHAQEVPGQESAAPENSATDPDNLQQGDTGAATTKADAPESPSDQAEGSTESGSEAAKNDGPGGHADEPGNPSADHQAQGAE